MNDDNYEGRSGTDAAAKASAGKAEAILVMDSLRLHRAIEVGELLAHAGIGRMDLPFGNKSDGATIQNQGAIQAMRAFILISRHERLPRISAAARPPSSVPRAVYAYTESQTTSERLYLPHFRTANRLPLRLKCSRRSRPPKHILGVALDADGTASHAHQRPSTVTLYRSPLRETDR